MLYSFIANSTDVSSLLRNTSSFWICWASVSFAAIVVTRAVGALDTESSGVRFMAVVESLVVRAEVVDEGEEEV